MLLRQILSETQKPVIQSEFTDNSTAAGIYQDLITNQLSDSLSKSDAIGLAKTFEQQLNRPAGTSETAAALPAQQTGVVAVRPKNPKDEWINGLMDRRLDPPSPIYPPIHKSTNPILP
jgi:Rod binding domain-containing protein